MDPTRTTNKRASVTKTSLIPPTSPITIEALVSGLNFGPFILHTPPNPAPTQSTSLPTNEPPFNINVKSTYTLIPSRISWHSTPCSTHSPFALQTAGIPSHVVRATSSGYTKPRAHTQPITCNTIPQKDTMIPFMAQSRYPLNS